MGKTAIEHAMLKMQATKPSRVKMKSDNKKLQQN